MSEAEKEDIERIITFTDEEIEKMNTEELKSQLKIIQDISIKGNELIKKQQKGIEREKQYIDFYKDLCDKQQKEIEELKEKQSNRSWVHIKENGEVEPLFYISKDKIKVKIKEIQNYTFMSEEERRQQDYAIERLKELLEEISND